MAQDRFHDIGDRLFGYLKDNPMSGSALAAKIGISYNTVLRIVKEGPRDITLEVASKIEKFLDTHGKGRQ